MFTCFRAFIDLLISIDLCFVIKKIKSCFAKKKEEIVLNYKSIFLRSKDVLSLVVVFNLK